MLLRALLPETQVPVLRLAIPAPSLRDSSLLLDSSPRNDLMAALRVVPTARAIPVETMAPLLPTLSNRADLLLPRCRLSSPSDPIRPLATSEVLLLTVSVDLAALPTREDLRDPLRDTRDLLRDTRDLLRDDLKVPPANSSKVLPLRVTKGLPSLLDMAALVDLGVLALMVLVLVLVDLVDLLEAFIDLSLDLPFLLDSSRTLEDLLLVIRADLHLI